MNEEKRGYREKRCVVGDEEKLFFEKEEEKCVEDGFSTHYFKEKAETCYYRLGRE